MQPAKSRLFALATTFLIGISASTAHAATLTVTNTGDTGGGSLREAIVAAGPGDVIEFSAGASGTISLNSPLPVLLEDITLQGPGAAVLTVSGSQAHRVFQIASGATVSISGLTIANGATSDSDPDGAGVRNQGTLTLEDCVISGNVTSDFGLGGGIDNFGGTLEVIGCTIESNIADTGGGINNDGTLTVIESTVRGNGAVTQGGGIDNSGNTTLMSSLVANNAAEFGGGIGNGQMLTVVNSTVSGNTADGLDSFGGGIDNFGGDVEMLHSTIAFNSASDGGGVGSNSQVSVKNSLIVNQAGGDNCAVDAGLFQALGDNLATDGSCVGFDVGSTPGIALGPLADNGGPTLTHALNAPSVAVDAVSDCTGIAGSVPVALDQRGVSRPQGAACDIGAFELVQSDLIFADGFE